MNRKLHILFISSWFPSRVLETNGDFIQRHAEAVALLHKVSVLNIISDASISKKEIIIDHQKRVTIFTGYVPKTRNGLCRIYLYVQVFLKILKKIDNFDLVHVHRIYPLGFFALFLKWFKNIPFLLTEHWTGYLSTGTEKPSNFEKLVVRYLVAKALFVCPVSKLLKKDMLQLGFKGRYVCIGNSIDESVFSSIRKNNTQFTLVHVSNLRDVQKNISGMLRVAKKLENQIGSFTWKFIGGSSKIYQELIKELNFTKANLVFENHLSQEDLSIHLQEANLCISFSNYESFGIVVPEALLCGTPVIATQTGIMGEMPIDDKIKSIPVANERALEEAILKHYSSKENLDYNELNLFIHSNFSKEQVAEKYSQLYFKMLVW